MSSRCVVYEEPRMAYLFLEVRRAYGLPARPGKVTGLADPYVHITVGAQEARTHIAAVRQMSARLIGGACKPIAMPRFTTHTQRTGYTQSGVARLIYLRCREATG